MYKNVRFLFVCNYFVLNKCVQKINTHYIYVQFGNKQAYKNINLWMQGKLGKSQKNEISYN